MQKLLLIGAVVLSALGASAVQAGDNHRHSNRGGYSSRSSGHFHGGYGQGNYGHGGWGGYGGGWSQPRYFHDTSHYDYHPPTIYRHGNHFHYQPGHYDWHQTGHWHR